LTEEFVRALWAWATPGPPIDATNKPTPTRIEPENRRRLIFNISLPSISDQKLQLATFQRSAWPI
jgi:hypothetical protein